MTRQAFEQEAEAASLIAETLDAEPNRSVLHCSAASLAIECGEFQIAERLIAIVLSGNPPPEIAEELKDLFRFMPKYPYDGALESTTVHFKSLVV